MATEYYIMIFFNLQKRENYYDIMFKKSTRIQSYMDSIISISKNICREKNIGRKLAKFNKMVNSEW